MKIDFEKRIVSQRLSATDFFAKQTDGSCKQEGLGYRYTMRSKRLCNVNSVAQSYSPQIQAQLMDTFFDSKLDSSYVGNHDA